LQAALPVLPGIQNWLYLFESHAVFPMKLVHLIHVGADGRGFLLSRVVVLLPLMREDEHLVINRMDYSRE